MTAALRVIQPGLLTTVQDLGRVGYQRLGLPVSGALDPLALRAANVIVGNPEGVAGLEMAVTGPVLEVEAASVRVALAGFGAELIMEGNGSEPQRVPALESVRLAKGGRLRVVGLGRTATAVLAIEGGLELPAVLGSQSTYVRGGFGGLEGRPLRAGDRLPVVLDEVASREEARLDGFDLAPARRVRVVLGPQDDYFTVEAVAAFLGTPYTVTREADRMGVRLEGQRLEHARGYDIVSDGIAPGTIQVPGSCQPIVLLADRQTTGGYPKIATAISADLAALGRVLPGMVLTFEAVTVAEAQAARRALEAQMRALKGRLVATRRAGPDIAQLHEANLVSGVVDAHAPPAG
jgi:biotin-dependent carboxylase-like uncharacterized protein